MSEELRIKGQAIRSFMGAVRAHWGEQVAERITASLSEEVQTALRYGGVVASGWYPIAWYRELHAALQEATGEGIAASRRVGAEGTRRDLGTVHRFVVRLFSPRTLLGQCQRIFRMYYDGGIIEDELRGGNQGIIRFSECHGFDEAVFADVIGGMFAILEECGGNAVQCSVEQRKPGGMVACFTWTE
jgi:hypothetical protein